MTLSAKSAEQLIIEKHIDALRRGFYLWPNLDFGKPPALGDHRWTADLILSTWMQAETGKRQPTDLNIASVAPKVASMCLISSSCRKIAGFPRRCRLI